MLPSPRRRSAPREVDAHGRSHDADAGFDVGRGRSRPLRRQPRRRARRRRARPRRSSWSSRPMRTVTARSRWRSAAEREGVSHLGVATLHEGIQLRQAGCRLPIVALSPLLPSEIDEAIAHDLSPTVGDRAFAHAPVEAAERRGTPVRCHVEVDTGMGRTGVRAEEAEEFLAELYALPSIRLASLYTHFPDADGEDLDVRARAGRALRALLDRLAARGLRAAARARREQRRHAERSRRRDSTGCASACSPYGHLPPNARRTLPLQPVMSLKSRIVQVRDLPAGTPISYARTFTTRRASTASASCRSATGTATRGCCRIAARCSCHGARVPIVGRVTMDLTMVDLTDAPALPGRRRGRAVRRAGRLEDPSRGGRARGARRCPTRSCARSASGSRASTCAAGDRSSSRRWWARARRGRPRRRTTSGCARRLSRRRSAASACASSSIVLDGVGIGALPDAADYGDAGSHTLRHVAEHVGGLARPDARAARAREARVRCPVCRARVVAEGARGRLAERSPGKDSTTGHWELAGHRARSAVPDLSARVPARAARSRLRARSAVDGWATRSPRARRSSRDSARSISGAGRLIVYTSADSVFQIAAHEQTVPLDELYRACTIARGQLTGEHAVGRVIARPFVGSPGDYRRTPKPSRLLLAAAAGNAARSDDRRRPHGGDRRQGG